MVVPAMLIPQFRSAIAIQEGVEKKILLKTWGGLGDQICAEPTLRWALSHFKDCEVSLASEHPYLFQHLQFKEVFNLKRERPIFENYFAFDTIVDQNHIVSQFMSHCLT